MKNIRFEGRNIFQKSYVIILESVGLPVEGITLVLGANTLFSMGSTIVNVVGDAVAALVVTRIQDGKLKS